MVDRNPIISTNKPAAEARPGNIALEVDRPLYNKGGNWDYYDYRNHILQEVKDMPEDKVKMPELHFFDGKDVTDDFDTVVMTSYPRSGNTLLRAQLERTMGIVTGSDCDITKKLN
jgi:hypothetical protein